jgi:hypothetical protein
VVEAERPAAEARHPAGRRQGARGYLVEGNTVVKEDWSEF